MVINIRKVGEVADGVVTEAKLATGAVTEDKIEDAAIAAAKLATGAVDLGTAVVTGQVPGSKIEDLAIAEGKLADGAVAEAKLGALSVTEGKIAAAAVAAAKMKDAAVDLGTAVVTGQAPGSKIEDLAISVGKLADAAVEEAKLGALAVSEAKIAALAVTEGKIGAGAVLEAKLADLSVATGKLQDAAVTLIKASDNVKSTHFVGDESEVEVTGITDVIVKEFNFPVVTGKYVPKKCRIAATLKTTATHTAWLSIWVDADSTSKLELSSTSLTYEVKDGEIDVSDLDPGEHKMVVKLASSDVAGTAYNTILDVLFVQ